MKYGKVIEKLEITGISSDGKSVGRFENRVIFVNQGAPGDVVDVQIVGKQKKFLIGDIIQFHERSADRVEPFCEHFGLCGGCKWQHISYEAQLRHKQDHVAHNLSKISKTDLPDLMPIKGSGETTYYRNKLEYTFSNLRWLTKEEIESSGELNRSALGFHIPKKFDKILNINHCWLQQDPSNAIRLEVKKFADENDYSFFDLKNQVGLLRNLIIRTSTTGDLMVIVQFYYEDREKIDGMMNHLKETFPNITSLLYIVNPKKNETYFDLPVVTYRGEPFIHEQMDDLKFRIGPKSFYQTNSKQAYELYKVAKKLADLKGTETVYDLYTGTGTIANFVAKDAAHVIGVEYVEEAIVDARINSEINGINNTTFLAGDMKDMINDEFVATHGQPDVIITDPPRAGMHTKVVEMLNRIRVKRLVYVSCNPATQARDLELLASTYQVEAIQPVDMFPQTHHVENVMLLTLK